MSKLCGAMLAVFAGTMLLAANPASANCGGDHSDRSYHQADDYSQTSDTTAAAGSGWNQPEARVEWKEGHQGDRQWKRGPGQRHWRAGKRWRMRSYGSWPMHPPLSQWIGQSHLPYGQERWHIIETSGYGDCVDRGPYSICRGTSGEALAPSNEWRRDDDDDNDDDPDNDMRG